MLYSQTVLNKVIATQLQLTQVLDYQNLLLQLGHEVENVSYQQLNNLVVGQVIEVTNHPDSDHLNICKVNIGNQILQIVCGARNVCANALVIVACVGAKLPHIEIKESEIRGVKSEGMLCALEELGFDKQFINPDNLDHIFIFPQGSVQVGDNPVTLLNLNDYIYDVSLTANRGDCLSYLGMVRDIYALLNKNNSGFFTYPQLNLAPLIAVNVKDANLQSAYIELNNPQGYQTPIRLKTFLARHKIASKNIITDITNAIMLITGQVFNVYDRQKINTNNIAISRLGAPITVNIDGVGEVVLQVNDLVIMDGNNHVIGIPNLGVVSEFAVTNNTTAALVEVYNIEPEKIREMNYHLHIKNEKSIRSEKGIDPNLLPIAINLINQAIQQFQLTGHIMHARINQHQLKTINYDPNLFTQIIGGSVDKILQYKFLTNLGFRINNTKNITVPSWRFDIFHDQDLVEEVLRIVGVDNILDLDVEETIVSNNKVNHLQEVMETKIIDVMKQNKVNELITYSLVSEEQFEQFNMSGKTPITMLSPLSNEHVCYRHSLIPSLLDVAKYNIDRQADHFNYFEIADTYYKQSQQIFSELHLAIVLGGKKQQLIDGKVVEYQFEDLLTIIDNLFKELNVNYELQPITQIDLLNPYAQAAIVVNQQIVGMIGIKHPNYYKKLRFKTYICEFNLSGLKKFINYDKQFRKISLTPAVNRQLTFTIPTTINFATLENAWNDLDCLDTVKILSQYIDETKKDTYKLSVDFTFVFEDTKTKEEIDQKMQLIINKAQEYGVIVENNQ